VAWLTSHTKKQYRLPSGTEWEYEARGNAKTHRWWGDELERGKANCAACGMTWEQVWDWFGLLPIKDKLTNYKDKNE
jgi:formylglycine-generating enzyme required for sulfatase activity